MRTNMTRVLTGILIATAGCKSAGGEKSAPPPDLEARAETAADVPVVVASAEALGLPPLVAKVYPGAVIRNTKGGKAARCGFGEGHHDAFCFLTKDGVEKVREFYAREGVTLEPMTGDDLSDLGEAVRLELSLEKTGTLYAGPVEYWKTNSAGDEPSYFHSVLVMSRNAGASAPANKAAILDDELFRNFALTDDYLFMKEGMDLLVEPEALIPLAAKHTGLRGGFLRMTEGATSLETLRDQANAKRAKEMMADDGDPEQFKTQASKVKAIDALLGQLERDSFPTLVMIQRSSTDGITKDPAVLQKEWRASFRHRSGK